MFLKLLDSIFRPQVAYAHCDIPCGIYETNTLLMAAHTIERMVEVMEAIPMDKPSLKDRNNFIRCVHVKEKHAALCEEQLVTLWADFFKPEHFEKWPDLHQKVWKAVNLCSDNKTEVSAQKAKELMAACREIDSIFKEAKKEPAEDISGAVSDNPSAPMKKLLGK
ncbi:superoxide dismutase, Ni [Candidatus Curtissbacteria bacterium]|nr:superoxide dismutase, Ni [Candidatus Curtissbacteria bacterium]